MRHFRLCLLLLILVLPLLAGCPFEKADQRIVLWTDRSEFAAYAQAFNSSQEDYKVEVVYKASPAGELTKKNPGRWDVAVGPFLNAPEISEILMPLEPLFSDGTLDKSQFYQSALEKGGRNSHQMLLPVSFNIPAFMFQAGSIKPEFDSFALSADSFDQICLDFNKAKSRHAKSAFSPLWNPESAFFFALLSEGLSAEHQNIEAGRNQVHQMIESLCGSAKEELRFREKYLYKNSLELLDSGHILFWYSDVGHFYSLPAERRRTLDFRCYQNHSGKIAVCEDMLWLGIPKKGGNLKGAVAFIKWMMDPQVQQNLILNARTMDIRSFGLAGGFSSIKKVNTESLPKLYPFINGSIPREELIMFPAPCQPDWYAVKKDTVIPRIIQ